MAGQPEIVSLCVEEGPRRVDIKALNVPHPAVYSPWYSAAVVVEWDPIRRRLGAFVGRMSNVPSSRQNFHRSSEIRIFGFGSISVPANPPSPLRIRLNRRSARHNWSHPLLHRANANARDGCTAPGEPVVDLGFKGGSADMYLSGPCWSGSRSSSIYCSTCAVV